MLLYTEQFNPQYFNLKTDKDTNSKGQCHGWNPVFLNTTQGAVPNGGRRKHGRPALLFRPGLSLPLGSGGFSLQTLGNTGSFNSAHGQPPPVPASRAPAQPSRPPCSRLARPHLCACVQRRPEAPMSPQSHDVHCTLGLAGKQEEPSSAWPGLSSAKSLPLPFAPPSPLLQ